MFPGIAGKMPFRLRKKRFSRKNLRGARLDRRHPCLQRREATSNGDDLKCKGNSDQAARTDGKGIIGSALIRPIRPIRVQKNWQAGIGGPQRRPYEITLHTREGSIAALQAGMPAVQSASPNLFACRDVLQAAEFRQETLIT